MRFGEVLDQVVCGDGACFGAEVPEGWGQGRATYGGLVAALAYRAARRCAGEDWPARALLISFVGPVEPGRADLDVEPLRAGRNASQYLVHLRQDGDTRAVLQAVFGASRDSTVALAAPPRPDAPSPDQRPEFPYIPNVTPEFTRHFEYRWTTDVLPFSGAETAHLAGWCRFRDDEPTLDAVEQVLALTDAWPVPVLPMLKKVAPASSLTWNLELVAAPSGARPDPNGWWFYDAHADAAASGYAQAGARLWTPDGHLAVASRQLVAIFG